MHSAGERRLFVSVCWGRAGREGRTEFAGARRTIADAGQLAPPAEDGEKVGRRLAIGERYQSDRHND
jgi:hypothetical protein